MTKTADRLYQIAGSLDSEQQEGLLALAQYMASPATFYAQLTPEQMDELDAAIAEADSGLSIPYDEFDRKLARSLKS